MSPLNRFGVKAFFIWTLFSAFLRVLRSENSWLRFSHRLELINHPLDPLLHPRHIEIKQQPDLDPAQLEIGQKLSLMNRQNFFDRLQLDDDAVLNQKIQPITRIDLHAVVNNRQDGLRLDP